MKEEDTPEQSIEDQLNQIADWADEWSPVLVAIKLIVQQLVVELEESHPSLSLAILASISPVCEQYPGDLRQAVKDILGIEQTRKLAKH